MMSDYNYTSIYDLHKFFFESGVEPSNMDVIKSYESNIELISESLQKPECFDYAVRIRCEYCFALSELKEFEKVEEQILPTLNLFKKIYQSENDMFRNVFYEKLIFSLMKAQISLKKYELARQNLDLLLKYFSDNNVYKSWERAFPRKKRFLFW